MNEPKTVASPLPKLNKGLLGGKVNFPVCLAPMVGLSHVALRQVLRAYLPEGAVTIWPTEMLNSRRLPSEDLRRVPEAARGIEERELVPQLLANDEKFIAPSVAKLTDWGAEGIDINMGCPVKKALSHNYGVALMGDPEYAAQVVATTVGVSTLPVSVKLRGGNREQQLEKDFLLRFVTGLVDAGASWITLHPRTSEQMRRGSANWSQIRDLKERLSIPVIGNGDVQVWQDALRMRQETNCDSVMVGRGLAARPWMLWQLGEELGFERPVAMRLQGRSRAPRTPLEEGAEYGRTLQMLWGELLASYGLDLSLRKFRFHVRMTSPWLDFGHALVSQVSRAHSPQSMQQTLEDFFSREVAMVEHTELRQ